MKNNWYNTVSSRQPLTQGDLIFDCPVLVWKNDLINVSRKSEIEILKSSIDCITEDVVVMTQACDLAHNKLPNVTLCKHISISDYRKMWEEKLRNSNNFPKKPDEVFQREFNRLKDGFVWNMSLLNNCEDKKLQFEHRIVDFYEIYTIPREFLEKLLRKRKIPQPRLLPPYREHLSQAFARFYMRVGLPTPINKISLPK